MTEKKHYTYDPDYAVSPGEILVDALEQRGISQESFAQTIGVSANTMSRLVKGELAMSSDMAGRIECALGVPASLWLNAETNYSRFNKPREPSNDAFIQ